MTEEVNIRIRVVFRESGPDLALLARVLEKQAAAEDAESDESEPLLTPSEEKAS